MDMESAPNLSEGYTQQEQLMARLSPDTEMEERLTRQLAFCRTQLEHIEGLLGNATARVQQALHERKDEPAL